MILINWMLVRVVISVSGNSIIDVVRLVELNWLRKKYGIILIVLMVVKKMIVVLVKSIGVSFNGNMYI